MDLNQEYNKHAYTVGNEQAYDQHLINNPNAKKLGIRDGYSGGWIWKDYTEAKSFADDLNAGKYKDYKLPDGNYAVYTVLLPTSFNEDTYLNDNLYHLKNDARLYKKANFS